MRLLILIPFLAFLSACVGGGGACPKCGFRPDYWITAETPEKVAADINVNARDRAGYTPLHYAVLYSQNPAVIEALLNAGADPRARKGKWGDGETPLHDVMRGSQNPAMIEMLLNAGADTKARGKWDENTPLHVAMRGGQTYAVAETPPDTVHIIGIDGEWVSPKPEAVKALLAGGADANARNKGGKTPLYLAVRHNAPIAVMDALLAGGANPNGAQGRHGETLLHIAEKPAVMAALLAAGADANARNKGGITPLHVAARSEWPAAVVKALLAAGATPGARDKRGNTPLHFAAEKDEGLAAVKALLAGGADANARADNGNTPLHYAALKNGDAAIIEALLNAGADAAARNKGGKTPFDLMEYNRRLKGTEVYRTLRDARE